MELIESLRKRVRPAMSVRKAAEAASISEGRWRSLAKGTHQVSKGTAVPTRAPADTLARMARTVGATPDQLREVGRGDAADELAALGRDSLRSRPGQQMTLEEGAHTSRSARLEMLRRLAEAPPTPHDEHFDRAERLLAHAHESVRQGQYLGAIHSLEGVESTVELLIDRVTDSAIQQNEGATNADQPSTDTDPSAKPATSETGDENEEVVRSIRPKHWDDAPPPPPIELADAASVGHKESDEGNDGE
ncbi:hypothetical protein A5746_14390 [Mycolicibacterium conceptionense]|uniref:Uncharacterized protein n=2 Tax=Mycobacteriaceae TaxID=1762 RepID=A0A1A1X5K8_9MYCO|nr:hypothetical protein A5726_25095 [Mycolicibacterium conceptionense]OBF31670.1 hypothetical protein A5720_27950 [Mycolicibacterium conceptionense]OBH97056.1 hypothetical protein A5716_16975 [Mycolicibacterium conceptionense]OMB98524.1 hypothetical protein A5746_14390 [Mycolicibacterium conceptionense]